MIATPAHGQWEGTMAASLESEAVFLSRAKDVGLEEASRDLLKANHVASYSAFAFICAFSPSNPDDAAFKLSVSAILGGEPAAGQLAVLRRLFYESHTLIIADLKDKVSRSEDTGPKRVPAPEKAARRLRQKARLPGIVIEGEYDPAHSLLDLIEQQIEDKHLVHIPLDKCGKREQERDGVKKDTSVKPDSLGFLKVQSVDAPYCADLTSDLRIRQAFTRRGLAYDQCNVLTFSVHEAWIEKAFAAMSRPAIPGYRAISFEQILQADRELFRLISERLQDNFMPDAAGVKPVDTELDRLQDASSVSFLLLPLPSSSSSSPAPKPIVPNPTFPPVPPGGGRRLRVKGKGKGKSKGKGKGKGSSEPPEELKNMKLWTSAGNPLCWGYHLARGCDKVRPGQACMRGVHTCCFPGCGKSHSLLQCPLAGNA